MLVGLMRESEFARSVDERWNAHRTCADIGVGAASKYNGIGLDPSLDESLLDELPEGFFRRCGPGVEKVLVIETLAGIAVNCDPADFQGHFLHAVEVLKSR